MSESPLKQKEPMSNRVFILRILTLVIITGIAFTILIPSVLYTQGIGMNEITVLFLAFACMIVIILADRIAELDFSKNKLRIKLSNLREELGETIKEVRENVKKGPATTPPSTSASEKIKEELSQAEQKLRKTDKAKSHDSLLMEADQIADAMRMLREIMQKYRG